MLKSASNSLILRGVLALIIGIVAIAWPGVTVLALAILFAVYAFMDAVLQFTRAFGSKSFGPVAGHSLLALIDVAAGVAALAWPDITVEALAIVVGIWAFAFGLLELWVAFRPRESAGERTGFILGGFVAIAFGVVVCARPDVGALTLALLYGVFFLFFGSSEIAAGLELRRGSKALGSLTPRTG